MVAGLKFLSKKGFNPQNLTNQKRVWEREEEYKNEKKRIKEREEQLQRERDDEELALSRGEIPRLKFMYDNAPQQQEQSITSINNHRDNHHALNQRRHNDSSHDKQYNNDSKKPASGDRKMGVPQSVSSILPLERQPGDDDAAAAFRRMLAAAAAGKEPDDDSDDNNNTEQNQHGTTNKNMYANSFGSVLHGSSVDRVTQKDNNNGNKGIIPQVSKSALEKAVGKKQSSSIPMTLEEQMERFPALKYAPRAKGMNTTDVGVSFKPLGAQIRNVKCLVCGIWGHSKGDRECSKSGWDPFSMSSSIPVMTTGNNYNNSDVNDDSNNGNPLIEAKEDLSNNTAKSQDAQVGGQQRQLDESYSSNRKRSRNHSKDDVQSKDKKKRSTGSRNRRDMGDGYCYSTSDSDGQCKDDDASESSCSEGSSSYERRRRRRRRSAKSNKSKKSSKIKEHRRHKDQKSSSRKRRERNDR